MASPWLSPLAASPFWDCAFLASPWLSPLAAASAVWDFCCLASPDAALSCVIVAVPFLAAVTSPDLAINLASTGSMVADCANASPDHMSISPSALVRIIAVLLFIEVLLPIARYTVRACPCDEARTLRVPDRDIESVLNWRPHSANTGIPGPLSESYFLRNRVELYSVSRELSVV